MAACRCESGLSAGAVDEVQDDARAARRHARAPRRHPRRALLRLARKHRNTQGRQRSRDTRSVAHLSCPVHTARRDDATRPESFSSLLVIAEISRKQFPRSFLVTSSQGCR